MKSIFTAILRAVESNRAGFSVGRSLFNTIIALIAGGVLFRNAAPVNFGLYLILAGLIVGFLVWLLPRAHRYLR